MFKVDNKDNIFHKHFSHLLLVFLLLEQVNAGWVICVPNLFFFHYPAGSWVMKKKRFGTQIYREKMKRCVLIKTLGSCFELHVFYKHNANEPTQPEIKGKFKHKQSIIVSLEGY